jgi:recombination protein RecA
MAKKELSFLERIEDKYGDFVVIDEEKEREKVKAISTGSISLDVSLGVGGIPMRRFTEIYGPEGCGKTTLCLGVAKNAIEQGYKVLYDDPEQTLDYSYVEAIVGKFDKSQFVLVQPETAEQALEIAEAGIQSEEFGLIVLDSIGALAPEKEKKDELTDANVGLVSKLMTKFSRRNAFDIRRMDVAFIGINQVRDKIGAYIPTMETPGGHSWKHILSVRIQLNRATDIEQDGEKIGINTKFVIKKNKLAPPFRTFTVPILFGKGIDSMRDLIQFAEMIGVLSKAGPYYKFEGETIGAGMVKTIEALYNNESLLDKVRTSCYYSVNSRHTEDIHSD